MTSEHTTSTTGSRQAVEYAEVGDLTLAYERIGDPDQPAVVLVMGLATQMLGWPDGFCSMLADEGFQVIRFDNRDIGLSTHLDDAGAPDALALFSGNPPPPAYRLDDMADDTVGLLDALGLEKVHLVGASMGGMIAQSTAIKHPDRLASLTSIMSTPAPEVGAPTPAAQAALLSPPPADPDEAAQRAIEVYRVIGSPGYSLDEAELAERARESFHRANDPAGVARQLAAVLGSPDRRPGLADLDLPTLVIHGKDDPLVQYDGGEATAAAVPGARLVAIPGMGHNLPAELWRQLVDEIAGHARSAAG